MITTKEFETVFHEYYSRLYYFAYDYVEDMEVSKDIVSEVFTAIWNDRERMLEDKLVGYLFISVRNRAFNYLKKQKNKEEYLEFCIQSAAEEGDEYWKVMDERIEEMTCEIEKMSPRTRYILEECCYHNKKYKEVAEVLEISTDGIKKHIVKAFAKLRDHFNVKKQ